MIDAIRQALLECCVDHDDAEWMGNKILQRIEAPKKANEDVYERALKIWGIDAQITMVFEEMAELQKELCKSMRGQQNVDKIAEEIADVRIMLEQMELLYDVRKQANDFKRKKIERLRARLEVLYVPY